MDCNIIWSAMLHFHSSVLVWSGKFQKKYQHNETRALTKKVALLIFLIRIALTYWIPNILNILFENILLNILVCLHAAHFSENMWGKSASKSERDEYVNSLRRWGMIYFLIWTEKENDVLTIYILVMLTFSVHRSFHIPHSV